MADDESKRRLSDMTPHEMRKDGRVRLWVFGVLALLGVIFILQNTETVTINLLTFDVDIPLIWVLIAMLLLGALLAVALQWRGRRRATRR